LRQIMLFCEKPGLRWRCKRANFLASTSMAGSRNTHAMTGVVGRVLGARKAIEHIMGKQGQGVGLVYIHEGMSVVEGRWRGTGEGMIRAASFGNLGGKVVVATG